MFNKKHEYKSYFSKIGLLENKILNLSKFFFNNNFNVNLSIDEYKLLLSPFIDLASNQYHHRIYNNNKINNPNNEIINLEINDIEFLEKIKTTNFQEEIDNLYRLSEKFILNKNSNIQFNVNRKIKSYNRVLGTLKLFFMYIQKHLINLISIFFKIGFSKLDLHKRYDFHFNDKLSYLLKFRIILISLKYNINIPISLFFTKKINTKLRSKLIKYVIKETKDLDLHLRISILMVFLKLPLSYIENFNAYRKITYLLFPKSIKFFLISQIHFQDFYKFYILSGKSLNRKIFLFIIQQGGGYGINKYHLAYDHAIDMCDNFFCYHKPFHKKHIRVSSPYSLIKKNKRTHITFITQSRLYFMGYKSSPEEKEVDIESKFHNNIINNLIPDIKKLVKIKTHTIFPSNYRSPYNKSDNLEKFYFKKELSLNEVLNLSKIVIITSIGTTLYESIAANIPTILILNPQHYFFNNDFNKLYDKMFDCNLIFTDELNLANFLNQKTNIINEWFYSRKVQSTMTEFKDKLLFVSDDYKSNWLNNIISKIN